MLLIEALTHASANKASSPPNLRLAHIGAPLVELLLVQAIFERARLALHNARIVDPDADDHQQEQSQTYSVSALKDETLTWPQKPSPEVANR